MALVNGTAPQHIDFVSYTGKYPNLCSGVLTLKIDGELHEFGYGKGRHEPFWKSGGECWFTNDYMDAHVSDAPWSIDVSVLPDKFKSYATEIDEVLNSSVPWGVLRRLYLKGAGSDETRNLYVWRSWRAIWNLERHKKVLAVRHL